MGILLSIADVIVVLAIVVSVPSAVWKGQPGGRSLLLSACITLAMLIFGLVSLSAASGLAESESSVNHVAMLIFLAATAVVLRMWWANKPA
jgi:hypothetical protein